LRLRVTCEVAFGSQVTVNLMSRRLAVLGAAAAGVLAFYALWHSHTPDLRRLYASGMERVRVPPVVIVPGILGSRLRERKTGRELWPGSVFNVLFSARSLALDIDPATLEPRPDGIEAYDLVRGVLANDFYGALIQTLEQQGGYVRGEPGRAADPARRRYYLFPYDWRQDNVVTVRKLDALIEQIRQDYGDPLLKVDIVAHSMGGLVTRYYIQYGTTDVLDGNDFPANFSGAEKIRTAVLLGTPNLGSVAALHSLLVGHQVGQQTIPPEALATMPSVYELLPHPITNWIVDIKGIPLETDLYFVGTWRAFHWSVFNPEIEQRVRAHSPGATAGNGYLRVLQSYFAKRIERARRFVWSLTYNEAQNAPVKLVVFGGDCSLTPARVVIESDSGASTDVPGHVRLVPGEIRVPEPGVDYSRLMLEPGDGEVTKPSLLARQSLDPTVSRSDDVFFPLAYAFFLCVDHEHLTGNINFQDNLLNVLLERERSWEVSDPNSRAAPER
jgi:pimeloyl-ACP methyl ester carboxylesterase